MNLNTDKLTTLAGAGAALCNSVGTVAGQMAPGSSMHRGDYVNLGMSLFMLIFGWATNKVSGGVKFQSPIAKVPDGQQSAE